VEVDAGSLAEDDEAVTADDSAGRQIPRRATPADAAIVAQMLHDFNTEFATPSPGPDELKARLTSLLAGDELVVLLIGEPATGLAVLSFRPNVWYKGPVAMLDELYVRPGLRGHRLGSALLTAACDLVRGRGGGLIEINVDGEDTDARRFYEAHGFSNTEPHQTDPLLYYYREL
jgi:GNAT superfamily N-acetyltransferase